MAATDAVTLIMNDHRVMERLLERLRSSNGDRRGLLLEVAARLAAHSHAEEMKVYPALAQAEPGEEGEVQHGATEHHEAEQMLHRLMAMAPDDNAADGALEEFIDAVSHHMHEEESELLPALRDAVDAQTLDRMGREFEEIRIKELQIAGIPAEASAGQLMRGGDSRSDGSARADSDTQSGGSTRGHGDAPDDGASRAELYEKAKQADVPGRSSMSKDELARALRKEG